MGGPLMLVGLALAVFGAVGTFRVATRALSEHPDPADPERNATRYVKPAARRAGLSVIGMLLLLIGFVVWLVEIATTP